ncbi:hypothetical protein JTS93_08850 [Clostridium botulinum]|nr:hypothetical protein [Clostridium botulinum]
MYCLIQKSSVKSFNEKYPSIKCIESEDGFLNIQCLKIIKNFYINLMISSLMNYIYHLPMEITQTLTKFFNMFKNKNDKTILYNCYGETVEKN